MKNFDRYWEFLSRVGDGRKDWTAEQDYADVVAIMVRQGFVERDKTYPWSVKITPIGAEYLKTVGIVE